MTLIPAEPRLDATSDDLDAIPLIPVPDQRVELDEEALAAWHDALSVAVGAEMPHDLLGLWVYPARGGARLVGPAALAADNLRVPLPSPRVPRPQCRLLEEILLDAGYGSALCLPVRAGFRDVGLMLVGAFRPEALGGRRADFARVVARQVAPTLARLADPQDTADRRTEEARAIEVLGGAMVAFLTPRAFAQQVGLALSERMPLERLELLVAGNNPGQSYRLDEHEEGPLWSRGALIVPRELLDPRGIMGDSATVVVDDAAADLRWRAWAADGTRSVIAARLVSGGRLQGHLVVGTTMPGAYDEDDAAFVASFAPWIAAKMEGMVEGLHLRTTRAQLASMHAVPNQLRRMATVLATTAAPGVALRDYFSEATALLPFHRVRLVVPTSAERAAIIVPGDARPLAEMPGTALGPGLVRRVLHGEAPHGAAQGGNEVDLVFPMRCAGRIVAAMILTTGTPGAFTKAHLALAQQVADGAAWAVAAELPARSELTA